MQIKNRYLMNCGTALDKLHQAEMPAGTSLKVLRNIKKVDEERLILDEARHKLLKKYGQKDESGELIVNGGNVQLADIPGFEWEMNEIMNQEADLDIKKLQLEDIAEAKLKPAELETIMFMLDEDL